MTMTRSLPAALQGTVIRFAGDGRRLGYPTANIATETTLADGVYFGFATMGAYENHPALIFIGTPVTTGDLRRRVEAHLLDIIDQDYYDQVLELVVQHFHRANKKFGSLDELTTVMKLDEAAARKWFKKLAPGRKVADT